MKYIILNVTVIFLYLASVWFVLWGEPVSGLDPIDRAGIIAIGIFVLISANLGMSILRDDM